MFKIVSILATAFVLAACSPHSGNYINVATGVDANGNVTFERVRIGQRDTGPAQSLSTFNPFTGRYN